MAEKRDIVAEVISNWERSRTARANLRYIVLDERSFMFRLNHYADETLNQDRNQHRIKPRGRQSFSKHRHKLGRIASAPINIDLRPASSRATPELNEVATAIVSNLINDPQTHYRRQRRRMVSTALASRAGAMTWLVTYDGKGKPRISARLIDPLNLHWAAGYTDADDPECPWVTEERFMGLDDIKEMKDYGWTIPADLHADGAGPQSEGDGITARSDIMAGTVQGAAGGLMTNYRRLDGVRVLLSWYRKDYEQKKVETGDQITLRPDEQYYACPQCGWRSEKGKDGMERAENEASGDNPSEEKSEGPGLPDHILCPECHQIAAKVLKEAVLETQLSYPDGRLVVVAAEQRHEFYNGPWPWKMRDIPYFWYPCYEDPFAQWAVSDTTQDRDEQCTINAITRKMYEATIQSGAVIITTDDLTAPNSREPFEFSDDPISLAIWRGQGSPAVTVFKPDPIAASSVQLLRYLVGDFKSDAGTSDLGLQGTDLRGVTATTANIAYKTGEVPVDDHILQLQEREGPFIGIGFDIWRSVNEARTSVPVPRDGGMTEWVEVRGSDLDDYQFVVTATQDYKPIDDARGKAAIQLAQMPPEDREWFAEAVGFQPSILKKIQDVEQKRARAQQAQQQAAQMGAGGPTANGASAPGSAQPPPPMQGIPPALMQRMAGR